MKILIISPYFSPFLGVGALRMSSFAKYLLTQNDEVSVLKLSNHNYAREMCGKQIVNGIKYTEVDSSGTLPYKRGAELFYEALDRLFLEKNTFDVMLCSCGPFYTMTAVQKISEKYNVPYLLDYRDLWIYDDREISGTLNKIRHELFKIRYKKFEKHAVENADLFITVTPLCLEIMQKEYTLQNGYVVYNGYDENATKEITITNNSESDGAEICFFGKLAYYSYDLGVQFLAAVKSLIDDGYKITVKHISETEVSTQKILEQIHFPKENYFCTGRKSYEEGMELLAKGDICAAIINYKRGLGTKVFDYIFMNKPIVSFAPQNGDFDNLLKNFKNAHVCQSKQTMKESIKNIIDNQIHTLDDGIQHEVYSRAHQNKQYRELILGYLDGK